MKLLKCALFQAKCTYIRLFLRVSSTYFKLIVLISSELHLFQAVNCTYFEQIFDSFKLTAPSFLIIQSFLSPPSSKIHFFQCNCERFKAVNFNGSSFVHLLQANYNYLKLTSPFQANVKCFKLIATMNHIFKRPAPYSRTSFKLTAWIL